MRYGEVIGRSFEIFRRHRYLWFLGALGGGEATAVGPFGFFGSSRGANLVSAGQDGSVGQVTRWLSGSVPLLTVLGVLLALFVVAYVLVSCAATGALVQAAAEHDSGHPCGRRTAWEAGRRSFLSIVGIRLLAFLLALVAAGAVVGLVVAGALSAVDDQVTGAAVAFVLAGLFVLVLVPTSVGFSIAVRLATRAAVLERLGTFRALGRGLGLLFGYGGQVLLVWLIGIALGIAVGLVASVAAALLAVPFGLAALAVYDSSGLAALLTVGSILLLVFLVAAALLAGGATSYLSVYWTLAFRRMDLDAPPSQAYEYPAEAAG